jgi:hypothetical protein
MSFNRSDSVQDTFTPELPIEDAKKKSGKGKAMQKGKAITSPVDMKIVPPKETSVSAEKGNKAKKVSIPKQKLQ